MSYKMMRRPCNIYIYICGDLGPAAASEEVAV